MGGQVWEGRLGRAGVGGQVWEGRCEAQTRGERKGLVCEETQTTVIKGLGEGGERRFITGEAATQQAALAALSQHP